jgi:hypothetical protein
MADTRKLIDVWDTVTFDEELRRVLDANSALLCNYWLENGRLLQERQAQTLRGPPSENVHAAGYLALEEEVAGLMEGRTIRAWHYTRLTPEEVAAILASGMQPMTLAGIAERLENAVAAGNLDKFTADVLFAASPYHHQTLGNREGRIWLTARPYPADHGNVEELVEKWGGESLYFNHDEEDAPAELLRRIGSACVVEIALQLALTTSARCAAENVLEAWSLMLGCTDGSGGGSDMVATAPIEAGSIIAIHREGDGRFETHADEYTSRFDH